jgi:hypothetical protein
VPDWSLLQVRKALLKLPHTRQLNVSEGMKQLGCKAIGLCVKEGVPSLILVSCAEQTRRHGWASNHLSVTVVGDRYAVNDNWLSSQSLV